MFVPLRSSLQIYNLNRLKFHGCTYDYETMINQTSIIVQCSISFCSNKRKREKNIIITESFVLLLLLFETQKQFHQDIYRQN